MVDVNCHKDEVISSEYFINIECFSYCVHTAYFNEILTQLNQIVLRTTGSPPLRWRAVQALKQIGQSSSLHSKKNFWLGVAGFLWVDEAAVWDNVDNEVDQVSIRDGLE